MQNKNVKVRKRVTVWDFVLMAVLICTAVFIIFAESRKSDSDLTVVVKKDSELVYSESLSNISAEKEICVDDEYNVILCISPDGVEVRSSDCGDKVCVNTGKITKSGQSIVCLPAHVSIELKGTNGEKSDSDIDVVVG